MIIALLYNPIAGRGRAAAAARLFAEALRARGMKVRAIEVGPGSPVVDLPTAIGACDCLAVIGGDGTVHRSLPAAVKTDTPIWHIPTGTENLFARQFSTTRNPDQLVRAIDARRVAHIDLGVANGASFATMCGVGFDANVVHRVATARSGSITHLSYVPHMLAELVRPMSAPFRVLVDGEELVSSGNGTVVIANTSQYACRLDPAPHATPTDGLLDVVVLHHATRVGLFLRMFEARFRLTPSEHRVKRGRGSHVVIESLGRPLPVQLDGEASTVPLRKGTGVLRTPISVEVNRGALPVLLPAEVSCVSDSAVVEPRRAAATSGPALAGR